MAFKYLNQCAVKLKTPELLHEAFLSYCAHIASGYPKQAWFFKKDGQALCGYKTIEIYLAELSGVLPLVQDLAAAEAEAYRHWFKRVEDSAVGKNERANTASLQMTMRNMFEWDAKTPVDDEEKAKALDHLAEALANDRALHAKQLADRSD